MRRPLTHVLATTLLFGSTLGAASSAAGQTPPQCVTIPSFHERCETWVATFDDGTNGPDVAADLAVSPDGGRLYVTGSSYVAGQAHPMFDSTTLAYDTETGASLWKDRFDDVPYTWDFMHDIAVSPDGTRVYVAGLGGLDFRGGGDFLLLAYDAQSGVPVWEARYDSGGIDEALAIDVPPTGDRIYVTGVSMGDGTDRDYATAGFDASSGELLWSSRYNGPGNGLDQPVDVVASTSGDRVFVTGWSRGAAGDDYATIAYETADPKRLGERLWVSRYDAAGGEDRAAGMALAPDGSRLFVTGRIQAGGDDPYEAATVAHETDDGTLGWVAREASGDGAQATAISVSPDGQRVFVAGSTASRVGDKEDLDLFTQAYSSTAGTSIWTTTLDPAPILREAAVALSVSPDGDEVFVTGSTSVATPTGRPGIVTAELAGATGDPTWVARYGNGSPGQMDLPAAMALSPSADWLFVVGASSEGPTEEGIPREWDDYLTLAYELA